MLNLIYIFVWVKLEEKKYSSKMFRREGGDGSEQTMVD